MANVIVELTNEMNRVEALYPSLPADRLQAAQRTVQMAHASMAMNSLEGMKEAIEELREIQSEPR